MSDAEELQALRRLADLESRAGGNRDANLGGTLPFFGMDTGIKIPPSFEAGLVGAGKAVTRVGQGVRQLLPGSNDKLDAQVADEEARYKPLADKHSVATAIGETVPYLAVPGGPLAMGAASALEYGTPGERAIRAGLGYGGAVAGKAVGRAFGPKSMGSDPSKLASEFFEGAPNKWGIPLTVAQNTGSRPAQIAESVLSNLPFGGAVNDARNASSQAFNRAAARTFGEDSTKITPELLGEAKGRIGGEIGAIASRNTIGVDKPLFNGLQDAAARASQELTADEASLVHKQIQLIWNQVDPATGAIPGTLYKATQSKLGQMAKERGGTLANVLGDVRTSLREGMTRSVSGEDAASWLRANNEYFNLQQVAHATRRTPGELSPSQLLTEVNAAQASSKFGGGNELADLARFAKQKLPDKIPNSGTAQRLFYQKLLTNPLAAGGGLLGAGYGADQMGINPAYAVPAALIPFMSAHALAGKPASDLTKKLLSRGGGLLGLSLAE